MKKAYKRLLAMLLALAMVFALAACDTGNSPSTDPTPSPTGQQSTDVSVDSTKETMLNFGFNVSVTTLDPFNNENAYVVLDMLYMMLFTRNGFGGELQYGLANGYEQVDEYTYVISIRDDVVDSKGNPTTAEDVAWSYNYCKENGNISKATYIESCTVTGENEVTLVLNSNTQDIFEDVTSAIWVVSKATYEACGNSMVMEGFGASGYEVTKFSPGTELVLTRTDSWWGDDCKGLADQYVRNVHTVKFSFITEAAQLQTGLETGTLQMAYQVNSLYSSDFQDMPGYNVLGIPSNTPMQLVFNCTDSSICGDLLVRQAIAHCVDRQAIVNSVTYGMGIALSSLGSNLLQGYQKSWENEDYYGYSIDKAKALLTQAGYDGEEIHLMIVANNKNQATAASIIQAACIEAGMNVVLDTYENATFVEYRKASSGMYDVFLFTAASSGQTSNMFRYYLDANQYGGTSINGIVDSKLQELIETACDKETMSDEVIDSVHQYVKDNCYQIGLIAVTRDCVYVDGIESIYRTGHGQVAPNAVVLSADWDILAD